jgi:N-acetylmuramoyl-L-alanine amidase
MFVFRLDGFFRGFPRWPGNGETLFVRQTFFAAIVIPFIVIADARADVSFSTVVIDPGHGGWDRGGIPGEIVPEKTVALDTALRLQKLLQGAGLRTVMTRTTDVYIPLSGRSAIANVEPDAIFVSIHYNAARRSGAHGIETYSENNRGAVLASRIQRQIVTRVSTENRGTRSAEYYVLRNCRLPAVLVECGFLTNPVEAQLALTPEYRETVAEQIAGGIIEQRQFSFPPLVPNHQGRLVHKIRKHRKVVDSERLVYPASQRRISLASPLSSAQAADLNQVREELCSNIPQSMDRRGEGQPVRRKSNCRKS